MGASPNLKTTTVTIANGQAVSGAADLGNDRLLGFQMPGTWTAADITFQGDAIPSVI